MVSGASAAVGYSLGVFFSWLIRFMISRDKPWPAPMYRVWVALGLAAVAGTVVMLVMFQRWQDQIRSMMGVDFLSWTAYPQIVIICVVVFLLLTLIGQAWGGDGVVWLVRKLNRIAPPRISAIAALVVAVLITVFVLNGVVANYGMKALNSSFAAVNDETTADSTPPDVTASFRRSRVAGDVGFTGTPGTDLRLGRPDRRGTVGIQRRPRVGTHPRLCGTGVGRRPARQRTTGGRRTRPYRRTATEGRRGRLDHRHRLDQPGDGGLHRIHVQRRHGDGEHAVLVSASWLSFLVDKERARQAGQALFEAVSERVRAIPEAQRPKLVVFGESLGSFAAESAFGTIPSLNARTDGALFVGPTFNNKLWVDTTGNRDAGTPESQPIYEDGRQVRFIADAPPDLYAPTAEWVPGRAVYLQHASDPISWWSPRLILREPDWLEEKKGRDVLPAMRWIPFVTFLQVSADMAVSTGVPDGHGHFYLAAIPAAWAEILQPPGWTPEKTEKLIPLLTRD